MSADKIELNQQRKTGYKYSDHAFPEAASIPATESDQGWDSEEHWYSFRIIF